MMAIFSGTINIKNKDIHIQGRMKLYKFDGIEIEAREANIILDKFKERYINKSYPERILFINNLNKYDKAISFEQIREINISKENRLFMYHERLKIVYLTNFEQICLYVEQLEPWEEIDCLIFDESLNWFFRTKP